MKKFFLFLVAVLLSSVSMLAGEPTKALTFPATGGESISSYTKEWTATVGDDSWTLYGFNTNKNAATWTAFKCGQKSSDQTATITSPAVSAAITDVVITVESTKNVSSASLIVLNGTVGVDTIDITSQFKQGDVDVKVTGVAGYSYKLTINSTAGSNGSTAINEVALYEDGQYVKYTIANTKETAYTVAKAIELIDAGKALTDSVYVKGIISQVDSYSDTYKSITYWISDDGTTTNQFEVYSGKGIDGADFSSVDDIKVGASVIVVGNMKKYGTTYEFNQTSKQVYYFKAPVADGEYLIQNVATGLYLAGGAEWGTKALLNDEPQWFGAALKDGAYTLDSHQSNGGDSHYLSAALWCDGPAANWTITPTLTDGVYTLSNGGKYLTGAGEYTQVTLADAASDASNWKFITKADVIATQATASATAPVDVTSFILDPQLKRNGNTSGYWTIKSFDGTANPGNFSQGSNGDIADCAESFQSANGFKASQTISGLKKGVYSLHAQGFYRQDGTDTEHIPYIYAGEEKSYIPERTGTENSMAAAFTSFRAGSYQVSPIYFEVAEDGSIEIGVAGENTKMWNIFGQFRLKYYGEGTIADVKAGTTLEAYNAATGQKMNTEVSDAMESAKTAYDANPTDATLATLQSAVADATASVQAYSNAATNLEQMKVLTESTNFYTADALKAYYTDPAAAYEAGTMTTAEANALQNPYAGTGWHAALTADDLLLSVWKIGEVQCKDFTAGMYINTWSTEGNTDGSNFKVPFFEYWTADANSLGANTLTGTINDVEAGDYIITADVRVRVKNNVTDAATGITLNGVDVCDGDAAGTAQMYIKHVKVPVTVGADGVLTAQFTIADGNNISWLSFQNVKYGPVTAPYEEGKVYVADEAQEPATKTYYLVTVGSSLLTSDGHMSSTATSANYFWQLEDAGDGLYYIKNDNGYLADFTAEQQTKITGEGLDPYDIYGYVGFNASLTTNVSEAMKLSLTAVDGGYNVARSEKVGTNTQSFDNQGTDFAVDQWGAATVVFSTAKEYVSYDFTAPTVTEGYVTLVSTTPATSIESGKFYAVKGYNQVNGTAISYLYNNNGAVKGNTGTPTIDDNYVWYVQNGDNCGNNYFYNMSAKQFLTLGTSNGASVEFTATATPAIQFTAGDAGLFAIKNAGCDQWIDFGWSGTDPCTWGGSCSGSRRAEFYEVQYVDPIDAARSILNNAIAAATAQVGTNPGYLDATQVKALTDAAQAVSDNSSATVDELNAAVTTLNDGVAALSPIMPEAGKYYMIVSAMPQFEAQQGVKKAMYADADAMKWENLNAHDKAQLWTLEPVEGGYAMKNLATGTYAGIQANQSAAYPMSSDATVTTLTSLGSAQFNMITTGSGYAFHTGGHSNGAGVSGNIVGWNNGASTGSAWYIIEAGDPDDYTSVIVNADLASDEGWATDGTKGYTRKDFGNEVKVGTGSAFDFSQTITLPAGVYKMTAQAAYRYSGSEAEEYTAIAAGDSTHYAKIYATTATEEYVGDVKNRYEGATDAALEGTTSCVNVNGKFVPNSSDDVTRYMVAGQYNNELTFTVYEEGSVKIGIRKTETPAATDYANIGAWTLYRINNAPTVIAEKYDTVTSYKGSFWEGLTLDVDGAAIAEALEASSIADLTIYSENPDGSRVASIRGLNGEDGWRDGEGKLVGYNGANFAFYVQNDNDQTYGVNYLVGGQPGMTDKDTTYTAKIVYVNPANNYEYNLYLSLSYIDEPARVFDVVKTIEIATSEIPEVAYSEKEPNPTFDVAEVAQALGIESLSVEGVETYIVNVTTGAYVTNTTDGWRDANGDACAWGSATNGFCLKLNDPTSGEFDYCAAHDANFKLGDTYVAKWAITYGDKAVVLNVTVSFDYGTGINGIAAEGAEKVIYNVAGQRLQKAQRGINIINGKKVLVK